MSQKLRLGDRIFQVFNFACEERRLDVAELLLAALELAQQDVPASQRRELVDAKAAEEHLRLLRQRTNAMH